MQTLGNDAIAQLTDESVTKDIREQRFRALFVEGFDIPAIGRFVLGRHWKTATEQQRTDFLQIFEDVIVQRFSPMFEDYAGETFEIGRVVQDDNPKYSTVASKIISDGEPINVHWRTRHGSSGLKIIDVMAEGASMGITLRSEYSSFIQSNGGDVGVLITKLQEKLAKN